MLDISFQFGFRFGVSVLNLELGSVAVISSCDLELES